MYIVGIEEPRVFEFELDGETYRVPSVASMSIEKAREYADASKRDGFSFALWIVDNLFPEDAREAVSELTISQLGALLGAYAQDAGVTLGE